MPRHSEPNFTDGEKLEILQHQLKITEDVLEIGFWEWNIKHDKIYWSNKTFEIFGVTPKPYLRYNDVMAQIHSDDVELCEKNTAHWLKNKGGEPYFYRIIKPNTNIVFVKAYGTVQCDAAGEPLRFIGGVIDISDIHTNKAIPTNADDTALIKICAWCNCVEKQGNWISKDRFIQDISGKKLTHGVCQSCKCELQK